MWYLDSKENIFYHSLLKPSVLILQTQPYFVTNMILVSVIRNVSWLDIYPIESYEMIKDKAPFKSQVNLNNTPSSEKSKKIRFIRTYTCPCGTQFRTNTLYVPFLYHRFGITQKTWSSDKVQA